MSEPTAQPEWDSAVSRMFASGYYCAEIEVRPEWVGIYFWPKYQRNQGHAVGAETLSGALAAMTAWIEAQPTQAAQNEGSA